MAGFTKAAQRNYMPSMADIDDTEPPRWLEFCCDKCLHSTTSPDTRPAPRCPLCNIRMTPDDLSIPTDRHTLSRMLRRRRAA